MDKSKWDLPDRILGLEKHERMTEDAQAAMLEAAVQTSYRRGGEESCLEGCVSKQTVKTKIHQLKFPKNTEKPKQKKEGLTFTLKLAENQSLNILS